MKKRSYTKTVLWLEIKKDLELKIINGTYKSADKLPSISEIKSIYSCGGSTAQKVLESMYNDGIVVKKRGVGFFVKPFCKDKLVDFYAEKWNAELKKIIREASSLGFDVKTVKTLFAQCIESIYSQ